jgi:hypothetical protein
MYDAAIEQERAELRINRRIADKTGSKQWVAERARFELANGFPLPDFESCLFSGEIMSLRDFSSAIRAGSCLLA